MSTVRCANCGTQVRAHEKDCPSCYTFCGFPNVRKAQEPAEVLALADHYNSAVAASAARGAGDLLTAYESAVNSESATVVCRSLDTVKLLLSSENAVYTSYYRQRASRGRRAEELPVEVQREATDVRVFPSYHEEISYGAISLDGKGVLPYGPCCMVLRSITIAQRATVFWENSVDFCNRVCPGQNMPIPPGYRATWQDRAKLAAAKAAVALGRHHTPADFSRILLEGDRFVEVHMYGTFNRDSVERILIPRASRKDELAMVASIRNVIAVERLAIRVEEYS